MISGYTYADLARLRESMLSGVKEISMGGRRQVFATIPEMQALADDIERRLVAEAGVPRRRRSSGTLMTRPF